MIACPKCKCVLEVRLTAAPPMQSIDGDTVHGDIGDLLDSINDGRLDAWDADFIKGLRERYAQYGERVMLSAKQRGILERIAGK